ncbi:peptidoglycan-binding protein [Promicromonospora sukumoe]|uniref:peptidoglycan-binding domain-containing protein n=1 Tax=Promicromonospora sukumoe TaxID=88382 RepID=UPI00365242EB
MPLWRNLRPGDKGDDVRSLQEELARLGFDVLPDGDYGANTSAAVIELFSRVGVAKPDGTLPMARVLWLPRAKVIIAECTAPLGATVGAGPIATTTATLASLHVSLDESGAVPGVRVVRYRDNSAPVAADGTVTDSKFLATVAAGAEYQSASAEVGQGVSLTLEYALAEPLQVAVVPPGALLDVQDASACVRVDGKAQSVQVVASQLGQTMVLFEDGATPSTVDLPARSIGGVAGAEGCA